MTQVLRHTLLDEEDAMKMVGHNLQRDDLHFGMIVADGHPILFHCLTEWREFDAWSFGCPFCYLRIAYYTTQ